MPVPLKWMDSLCIVGDCIDGKAEKILFRRKIQ